MTSGDPALAHLSAQSRLIGLSSPLVIAQAESRTQPLMEACSGLVSKAHDRHTIVRTVSSSVAKRNFIRTPLFWLLLKGRAFRRAVRLSIEMALAAEETRFQPCSI